MICNATYRISGQGSHVLQTDQAEEISEIISHASVGKSAPLIKRQTGKRSKHGLDMFIVTLIAYVTAPQRIVM